MTDKKTILKAGQRKLSHPRPYKGQINKSYYEPMYGTPECNYTGEKKGRKTLSEKLELQKDLQFKKTHGEYIHYFD